LLLLLLLLLLLRDFGENYFVQHMVFTLHINNKMVYIY